MAEGVRAEVEAAAAELGIELVPWQVDLGVRVVEGGQFFAVGGRGVGRATVMRVVDKVREDRADSPGES